MIPSDSRKESFSWRLLMRNQHRIKVSDDQVREMRKLHLAYVRGYGYLAARFNCGVSTVRDIVTFRTRKSVV